MVVNPAMSAGKALVQETNHLAVGRFSGGNAASITGDD